MENIAKNYFFYLVFAHCFNVYYLPTYVIIIYNIPTNISLKFYIKSTLFYNVDKISDI